MTRSDVRLVVGREEGVLVRVLGLVVRRGFEPVEVASGPGAAASTLAVRLILEGERPIENLVRQLRKLYDVRQVEVRV
jgi:acetolactate synthase regulatory subunit